MSDTQPDSQTNGQGHEYLTFRLADEEYGVDILKVQEIRGFDPVTRIASAPDFIRGVINLRGNIVPIVDLRVRLRLGVLASQVPPVVIILSLGSRVVGMVVDGVSDVVDLQPGDIWPAPELGGAVDTRYVTGLGSVHDRMLILIDIEALVAEDILNIAAAA